MSQCRSELHILLNFSIYIFPRNLYWNRFYVWYKISDKKLFLIDPNVKGSMSETFDKSQMSETIDVPAGWNSVVRFKKIIVSLFGLKDIELTESKFNKKRCVHLFFPEHVGFFRQGISCPVNIAVSFGPCALGFENKKKEYSFVFDQCFRLNHLAVSIVLPSLVDK